jgi:hypothetical protein
MNCSHIASTLIATFSEIHEEECKKIEGNELARECVKITYERRKCECDGCGKIFEVEVGRVQFIQPVYDWVSGKMKTPD